MGKNYSSTYYYMQLSYTISPAAINPFLIAHLELIRGFCPEEYGEENKHVWWNQASWVKEEPQIRKENPSNHHTIFTWYSSNAVGLHIEGKS